MSKKQVNHSINKEFDNSLALKAGILYLIAEIFTRSISFLATPVFTRILPITVFADVKIFESWAYLLAPIISISLYQSIARAKFDYNKTYHSYLSSMISLMVIITVIVGLLSYFVRDQISYMLNISSPMLLLMLFYCLAYNSIQCVQVYERQRLNYKSNIILTMLAVIPGICISVFCVLKYRNILSDADLLTLRLVSFFGPTTIIGFIVIAIAIIRGRSIVNIDHWKYGIKFSVPMLACALSTQIFYQSDKIMVMKFCGAEAAAIVALATTVGYIMDILIHAVDNAWRPWLFEQLHINGYDAVKQFWKYLLFILSIFTWTMVMFGPELVFFLGGPEYKEAVWLMGPIICASLANFIMIGYTAIEQYYKKTRFAGYASIIAAIANLILNYVGIKLFGYMAVAYTTAASYVIAIFIHYLFVRRFEKSDVLLVRKSSIVFIFIFGIGMATMLLYGMGFWARSAIFVIVIGLILILFRNYIKNLIIILKKLKEGNSVTQE